MRTIKISLAAFMLSFLAYSCAKDGATGPQGPQGPAGAANVYTDDFIVDVNQWQQYNNTTWEYITQDRVPTTDFINVYVSLDGNGYTPLTQNSLFYPGDELTYAYGNGGNVTLWYYFSSQAPDYLIYVKVADIPPAIYIKHPNTNWSNYNEVAALPEVKMIPAHMQK
jgi:hypothetical protein